MNLFTGESADELYGGQVPPTVRALLHEAQAAAPEQRPALLWAAHASAPTALAPYYLLYKCHAGRREFELAERAARLGLREAARQAGLPEDWRAAEPGQVDFSPPGAARFWAFTLKALAFIRLRSGAPDDARELLAQLERLDPGAQLGQDVTSQLLAQSLGSPPDRAGGAVDQPRSDGKSSS